MFSKEKYNFNKMRALTICGPLPGVSVLIAYTQMPMLNYLTRLGLNFGLALVSLRICVESTEPSLLVDAISILAHISTIPYLLYQYVCENSLEVYMVALKKLVV